MEHIIENIKEVIVVCNVFWAMFKSQPQQRLSNFNSYLLPELKNDSGYRMSKSIFHP